MLWTSCHFSMSIQKLWTEMASHSHHHLQWTISSLCPTSNASFNNMMITTLVSPLCFICHLSVSPHPLLEGEQVILVGQGFWIHPATVKCKVFSKLLQSVHPSFIAYVSWRSSYHSCDGMLLCVFTRVITKGMVLITTIIQLWIQCLASSISSVS